MKNEREEIFYFKYGRKSSEPDEKQALSIESQMAELAKIQKRYDIPDKNIFMKIEEAHSAKIAGTRPKFNEMVKIIKEKNGKFGILDWHPDRLSRNNGDMTTLVSLLESGKLVEIITNNQVFRNEPFDKFMFGFQCLQAKLENDKKGVDVKRGLNTKAEKGWLPNGAKPGYMNDRYAEKGNKTVLDDPIRFPLIRQAWEMLIYKGFSVTKILDKLNNDLGYRSPVKKKIGGKPMFRSQIYLIFRDPFYYGYFEFPTKSGTWHHGLHHPMITKKEFETAQIILGRKMAPNPKIRELPYSGVINCASCGARVTVEEKIVCDCRVCGRRFSANNNNICPSCKTTIDQMEKPKIRHYIYYHCTKRKDPNCVEKSVEIGELEKQLKKKIRNIYISPRFKDWALKYIHELDDKEKNISETSTSALNNSLKGCEERLNNLLQLMISGNNKDRSLMSDDEYKIKKEEILNEKRLIEEKLSGEKNSTEWIDELKDDFDFATKIREKFKYGTEEEKRSLLIKIGSKLTLKDKIVEIYLKRPYKTTKALSRIDKTTKKMFEPRKIKEKYGNLENYWDQNPLVLHEMENIRDQFTKT